MKLDIHNAGSKTFKFKSISKTLSLKWKTCQNDYTSPVDSLEISAVVSFQPLFV